MNEAADLFNRGLNLSWWRKGIGRKAEGVRGELQERVTKKGIVAGGVFGKGNSFHSIPYIDTLRQRESHRVPPASCLSLTDSARDLT